VSVRVLEGHVLDVLSREQAGSYHVCVTSPPYWQLRAYGTEPQRWGDGWVGELGQEDSPEAFIAHLVDVFRAVRRVLRDDGSVWVNLAGAYFSEPGGQNGTGQSTLVGANTKHHLLRGISEKAKEANRQNGRNPRGKHPWLKALDWVDVPGLFARAMQEDGWLWRSDVTWVKPSALPESVSGTRWERCRVRVKGQEPRGSGLGDLNARQGDTSAHFDGRTAGAEWADCPGCARCAPHGGYVLRRGNGRPTKSSERVLVFAKRPGYYWDAEAVREPNTPGAIERFAGSPNSPPRDKFQGWEGKSPAAALAYGTEWRGNGHSMRDVWSITSEPLKDAHYAAYPTALPDRCIRAGTSEWGCCPACGAPWARFVDTRFVPTQATNGRDGKWGSGGDPRSRIQTDGREQRGVNDTTTLGWRPTCRCPGATEPPVPCRVLDPFAGAGSTGLAANRLGRDATLVELKPQYAALARTRIGREPLSLFASRPEEVPV
jgi:DNA modification methylase